MSEAEMLLITLHVPPALEESIVDCLLTFESEHGFSSSTVYLHDHLNEGLSVAEQVSGRQKKIRFQMIIAKQDKDALINKLRDTYSNSGIRYWITPILNQGKI